MLDTILKDMLISLQSSLMSDLSSLITKFSSEIHSLGVSYIEDKVEECTTTVNNLVDAYDEVQEEQSLIKAKLGDLEDRSHHNNVKLCAIPESVPPADLHKYASDLMHAILPAATPLEISIDRIHWLAKPPHLANSVPMDVLMRV